MPADITTTELIQLLVDRLDKDQIDARDADGYTPLMWAAGSGNSYAVGALLELGADPWLEVEGQNALAIAGKGLGRYFTRKKLQNYMKKYPREL